METNIGTGSVQAADASTSNIRAPIQCNSSGQYRRPLPRRLHFLFSFAQGARLEGQRSFVTALSIRNRKETLSSVISTVIGNYPRPPTSIPPPPWECPRFSHRLPSSSQGPLLRLGRGMVKDLRRSKRSSVVFTETIMSCASDVRERTANSVPTLCCKPLSLSVFRADLLLHPNYIPYR